MAHAQVFGGEDRLRKLLHELPIEIHESGLLLVLRTLPGSAHAIAAARQPALIWALERGSRSGRVACASSSWARRACRRPSTGRSAKNSVSASW